MSKRKATNTSAYDDAAGFLSDGIDSLFSSGSSDYALIDVEQIEVKQQIREVFEDEENTLADLAESIKSKGVLQPVLLRHSQGSGYELVAGERRFRAAKLAGLEQIPAVIREMSDEEAEDAQLAENIHRKNLTQIEEAKKIQKDLDRLGSTEAVLAKHHKSKAWLSKTLSLLTLPGQTKRLVTEDISADLEVINAVKGIEKIDPAAAKELVDGLKAIRGRAKPGKAREKVEEFKNRIKPRTKRGKASVIVAASPQTSVQPPTQGIDSPRADHFNPSPANLLMEDIYQAVTQPFGSGYTPDSVQVYTSLTEDEQKIVDDWLSDYHGKAAQTQSEEDPIKTILAGLREGRFGHEGSQALALAAYLHGLHGTEFDSVKIISSVNH